MNRFYIQIVFFLLSVFLHVNNKTLATESAPGTSTTPESTYHYLTPEEVFVNHQHLLCTNPEEIKGARELMNEAIEHLKKHAESVDDYETCRTDSSLHMLLYKKKHDEKTDVEKIHYTICGDSQYYDIIYNIWDPNHDSPFNNGSVKITRVYDPSLVMIQQRYEKKFLSRQKYFYALVKRARISGNKTIIVMTTPNINDHNPSKKIYKNKIIENANLFKTDIDSEEDIRKGKLEKTVVNLAGYIVEANVSYTNITYVESIDGHATIYQEWLVGKLFNYYFVRR
ncbi:fam-a protein [Plasmodium chabaudi chabaudi]|uniref:Fam-a protein n=1 Tax=Plasmodium chabaudi chabaudi TaxID=31271 RepID=A0A4V6M8P3_PLACU|nr:fam-a protein [Plasmodium chabaudi chabaudi]VTZ66319.1 fam-a protein [Plasmodium chabaudi chabaudi]|eukprot:XP_016653036.1 fam-a protein [Plasmodium chabaudi chabaudi]